MTPAPSDLLTRWREGDAGAFAALIEPHRAELHVHCYRMLGSLQDAEDAVQETFVAAWQGLDDFEERASVRTWLYRIATNRCLNAIRAAGRRPVRDLAALTDDLPTPTRLAEVPWLDPYPDVRLEEHENISLAFVTAAQVLPARQRAVLILRDVLGFHAEEVATQLDATVDSVESALKRARRGVRGRLPPGPPVAAPTAGSPAEARIVDRFARAYSAGDVDALVELLTDDVRTSMPPAPHAYEGREHVARFFAAIWAEPRSSELLEARANGGQPAFATYDGSGTGTGLTVLTLEGDRVGAITRFEPHVLPWFGLPKSLAAAMPAR